MDGHLDLAANVIVEGRDYTLSAAEIRAIQRRTDQQATVSLPDLVRGGVVFVTLFAEPDGAGYSDHGYTTPQGAERQALDQLAVYERREDEGRIRIIRSRGDLERHLAAWESDRVVAAAVLMEGGPTRSPGWRISTSGGVAGCGSLARRGEGRATREVPALRAASRGRTGSWWPRCASAVWCSMGPILPRRPSGTRSRSGACVHRLALERPGAHAGRPAHGEPTNDSPRSF